MVYDHQKLNMSIIMNTTYVIHCNMIFDRNITVFAHNDVIFSYLVFGIHQNVFYISIINTLYAIHGNMTLGHGFEVFGILVFGIHQFTSYSHNIMH